MSINLYRESFVFLTNLAYKCRFALPILMLCGCLLMNVRISMELTFEAEQPSDEENPLEMEMEVNDADSTDASMDEFFDFNDSDSTSSTETSEYRHTVRTLCLDVEIDQFYPTST